MMFVDAILPLAVANTYTYLVPKGMESEIKFGVRIIVPFGSKKIHTGLVYKIHNQKPDLVEPKEIMMVLDSQPIVSKTQIELWEWIANYYQCKLGEIYKAALPSGLKLESETMVTIVDDFEADCPLKPKEQDLLDILSAQKKEISISDLAKQMNIKNCLPIVKNLMEMGAITVKEEVIQKYRAKTETYVMLAPEFEKEERLHELFDLLMKAPKQLGTLMDYLTLSRQEDSEGKEVSRKLLAEKSGGAGAIKALTDKKIFICYEKEVGRISYSDTSANNGKTLSPTQQMAYEDIVKQFAEKQTVLLHGVTSSGKTEIYIKLIKEVISGGKQALFLLPEIALTTQITTRLRRVFGAQMCVYHSKFSDAERVETWNSMLKGEHCQLILGVRSSIFLPFENLGLIIVDEEHENTYKQMDPAPRYNARDCAQVLAAKFKAKVLLGSATPSIESYFNAKCGKYGLTELATRYEGIQLPDIIVADTEEAYKKKEMQLHFSKQLIEQMNIAFKNKEQVILFQNRRGFAPYVQCKACGYVAKCKNCDVSLTYHKFSNLLSCHYCSFTHPMVDRCPACGNPSLEASGLGTEKIEEEVTSLFPDVKVERLDLDTARSKTNFERIISDFEQGKTDVLVGTQMISKGLDFGNVRVVGILNADPLINHTDFRATEKAFQMMAQVSGRAGRRSKRGTVVIQTSMPNHPVVKQVCSNNYIGMYEDQIKERLEFNYPPFFRLSYIYLKGKDESAVGHAAVDLGNTLRSMFADRVIGPDIPVVGRVQNLFIRRIMLKVERNIDQNKAKEMTKIAIENVLANNVYKSIFVYEDVDPA